MAGIGIFRRPSLQTNKTTEVKQSPFVDWQDFLAKNRARQINTMLYILSDDRYARYSELPSDGSVENTKAVAEQRIRMLVTLKGFGISLPKYETEIGYIQFGGSTQPIIILITDPIEGVQLTEVLCKHLSSSLFEKLYSIYQGYINYVNDMYSKGNRNSPMFYDIFSLDQHMIIKEEVYLVDIGMDLVHTPAADNRKVAISATILHALDVLSASTNGHHLAWNSLKAQTREMMGVPASA